MSDTCKTCGGDGFWTDAEPGHDGPVAIQRQCEACAGTGKSPADSNNVSVGASDYERGRVDALREVFTVIDIAVSEVEARRPGSERHNLILKGVDICRKAVVRLAASSGGESE